MEKAKAVIASNNRKKLEEMKYILGEKGFELLSLEDIGFSGEIEETGSTFEENALIKARRIAEFSGMPAISDDSGLVVDALGGEPGVYSARYGGDSCKSDRQRYELLLKNMAGVKNRSARFVSCIACVDPVSGRVITAEGSCEGEIAEAPSGDGGFGYDPVFIAASLGRTMAEISPEEKNKISHRARAIEEFAKKL
ncbi:MAG: RdgB/HAM1 family non-canonical purine NTP pyrophosphatase [Oscillospiraceae bacterium]|jgi:XTP/dITP diphosphohydrolase|nr:RdgB/HAM1 family non-canonical purine NTP pyrophosphatase [Oscillospiraceae bacterium]